MPRPPHFTADQVKRLQRNIKQASGEPIKKEKGKMHDIVDEVVRLRGLLAGEIVLLEGFIQQFTDAGMLATAEQLTGYVQELKEALQNVQKDEK